MTNKNKLMPTLESTRLWVNRHTLALPTLLLAILLSVGMTVLQAPETAIGLVTQSHSAESGHWVGRIQQPMSGEEILILHGQGAPEEGDWVFTKGEQREVNGRAVIQADTVHSLPVAKLLSATHASYELMEQMVGKEDSTLLLVASLTLALLAGLALRLGGGLLLGATAGLLMWHAVIWANASGLNKDLIEYIEPLCFGAFLLGMGFGASSENSVAKVSQRIFACVSLAIGCIYFTGYDPLLCAPVGAVVGLRYPPSAPLGLACASLLSSFGYLPILGV